jgi:hypothetical protein
MTTPTANPTENDVTFAVGKCLLRWAVVEFQILFFLRNHCGLEPRESNAIWTEIKSFDAKVTLIQKLFALRAASAEIHSDAILLLNEARTRYKNRNEIAHGTLMMKNGTTPVIEPFFNMDVPKSELSLPDVEDRTAKFDALSSAFGWLMSLLDDLSAKRPTPLKASPPPPPDLVRALREAQSQRNKEQRERDRLLGHVRKLIDQNRLPDWPPA